MACVNLRTILVALTLFAPPLLSGCAGLAASAGGGAAGGLANALGASPTVQIIGAAVGAGIATEVEKQREKNAAKKMAEAFEDGRSYERLVEAQNEWYKLTLMPDVPEPTQTDGDPDSRNVKTMAPAENQGGLRLEDRPVNERVLP
jgi:hypothetical protein